MATEAEVYKELDDMISVLVEGFTLSEIFERLAAAIRKMPPEDNVTCPGGTVFNQRKWQDQTADTLEGLA